MNKSTVLKVSSLAMATILLFVAFGLNNKKEFPKQDCKKCCQQNCLPEPKKASPEYIFYETLNGHLIVSNYKQ